MKNITINIDLKHRPILNSNARHDFFDSVRIANLYENKVNRVFSKLYNLDASLINQLKHNIYDPIKIREGKR